MERLRQSVSHSKRPLFIYFTSQLGASSLPDERQIKELHNRVGSLKEKLRRQQEEREQKVADLGIVAGGGSAGSGSSDEVRSRTMASKIPRLM